MNSSYRSQVRKAVQAAQQAGVSPAHIKRTIHSHMQKGVGPSASTKQREQAKRRARGLHNYATAPAEQKKSKLDTSWMNRDLANAGQAAARSRDVANSYLKELNRRHGKTQERHQVVWNLVHWIASKIPYAAPLRAALRRVHGKHAALTSRNQGERVRAQRELVARINSQEREAKSQIRGQALSTLPEFLAMNTEQPSRFAEGLANVREDLAKPAAEKSPEEHERAAYEQGLRHHKKRKLTNNFFREGTPQHKGYQRAIDEVASRKKKKDPQSLSTLPTDLSGPH